jgi:Rha family phage regulatory protein
MEENTAIQLLQMDGKVLVDSRIVAKGIGIQHHNLMQTIYTYQTELEEFDQLQFETEVGYRPQGGGNPIKYALLNRNQIGVVTSLSRNTAQVVRFKVDLFKAIDKMEKELAETKEQLADAMATLGELRGMLQAILQGDVDTLAVMKASASLAQRCSIASMRPWISLLKSTSRKCFQRSQSSSNSQAQRQRSVRSTIRPNRSVHAFL